MWALSAIASFTALFSGLAFTFGGLHAASLLIALAGLARWLYTRMDSIVVRLHGARRLYFEEAPRLHELVAHLSIAARIPHPHLYVMRSQRPNAFSLGRSPQASSIILTSAALSGLDEAEICAMVAHELAHIAHGHTRRATLVAALTAVMTRCGARFGWRRRTQGQPARAAPGAVSRRAIARLHRLGTPPERDLAADRMSARLLGDTLGLAALLARLKERVTWGAPVSFLDVGTPFTIPILDGISEMTLNERIHQLKRMAAEEQARRAKAFLRRTARRGSRFYPRAGAPQRMSAHPWPGRRVARLDGGWTGKRPRLLKRARGAHNLQRSP